MSLRRAFAIVGVVCILAVTNASAQNVPARYRAYNDTMRAHGMAALIPASSDFNAGYVYRLVPGENGARATVRTVCSNAFLTPPREVETRLPNTHRFTNDGITASLDIAPIDSVVSASLGAQFANARTVDMTFGEMRDFEIAELNQFDTTTGATIPRRINPACLETLRTLRRSGDRFRDRVFLVLRSTSPQSFTYTLAGESDNSINLSANLEGQGAGRAGWTFRRVNNQTFSVVRDSQSQEPEIFVAAQIMRLTRTSQLTTVSEDAPVDLGLDPPEASDLEAILPGQ